mmetsp:Transcript_10635/g.24689  ORF Transcript_10635/g.24689 Transcript_10635/m.24689 type:complete len:311 (+) Transcript_10635:1127-2059(+)
MALTTLALSLDSHSATTGRSRLRSVSSRTSIWAPASSRVTSTSTAWKPPTYPVTIGPLPERSALRAPATACSCAAIAAWTERQCSTRTKPSVRSAASALSPRNPSRSTTSTFTSGGSNPSPSGPAEIPVPSAACAEPGRGACGAGRVSSNGLDGDERDSPSAVAGASAPGMGRMGKRSEMVAILAERARSDCRTASAVLTPAGVRSADAPATTRLPLFSSSAAFSAATAASADSAAASLMAAAVEPAPCSTSALTCASRAGKAQRRKRMVVTVRQPALGASLLRESRTDCFRLTAEGRCSNSASVAGVWI